MCTSRGDGVTGGVGVVAPVAEHRARGTGSVWAPGCNGSRRTINRVPSGQSDRSTRSVSSATAAPSRSSPSWRQRRRQRLVVVERDPADGGVNGLVGAGHHREADVASRNRPPHEVGAARRVDPHLTGRRTSDGIVAGVVADGDLCGQLGDRRRRGRRRDRRCCWPRRCPAATARASVFAGGIGEAVDRMRTRTRPCSSVRCRPCSPSGSRCSDESMSNTTVAVPVVAAERRHTRARTSAIASHRPASVDASM